MRDPGFRDTDDATAIESVDCTPRPRYRETPEQFERRMAAMSADAKIQRSQVGKLNRKDALRWYTAGDGTLQYFTRCACGWCGVRVSDPEVARREYDTHACALDAVEIGVSLHRKEPLPANWAAETKALIEQQQTERALETMVAPREYTTSRSMDQIFDDATERMKLLELK